jgi:hypothetical protein
MGRPFHHGGITDDHRLVRLVDADCFLTECGTLGPRLNREVPLRDRAGFASQHIEQCFGDSIACRCAPPPPIRIAHHGKCRETVVVGDNGQALAVGVVERVERLRQPTPDVARPPFR